jgi:glutamate 5-kinase
MSAFAQPNHTEEISAASLLRAARRVVIKIGSETIVDPTNGKPQHEWLYCLAQDVRQELVNRGKITTLVTSGAGALGRGSLGIAFDCASKDIPVNVKQAAAAIGQAKLINLYRTYFNSFGMEVAQALLTPHDTGENSEGRNARNMLEVLRQNRIIPVINENDTTATQELCFGDNDNLAALITCMIGADLLIMISSTDGLYTDDPRQNEDARHIKIVRDFEAVRAFAGKARAGLSTGGMDTKLAAAEIAHKSGANVIITSGKDMHPLHGLLTGEKRATIIPAPIR